MNQVPTLADPRLLADRAVLQAVGQYLDGAPIVDQVMLDPDPHEPRKVRAELDEELLLLPFGSPRLVIEWFVNDNFFIQLSSGDDGHWECQWHRHYSPNHSHCHIHYPPEGDRVESLSVDTEHPIDVVSTVLRAIKQFDKRGDKLHSK